MTSRRRNSLRTWTLGLLALAGLALLATAEAIVSHGLAVAVLLVALPAAGYALGRRHGGRRIRHLDQRPARERAADELARLREHNAKLRAKVRALSDTLNGPEIRP